ncbi:hypothetical protein ASPBRDRAFT_52124 [Aspergillus brasiliensis CBS 101740]|uniref:Uncharacterized protein n=1 Tax=Aspergillus brasiliensis (strain CBS 101740 / IMI 381727 / IBT 21946) TaxID=767769 RepID=A0A1L9UXZ5_ASPBC|nr:hypothetical protein ASPBRDRAFT_52124 [Aspergillus brasiliensis CBS 101740]
MPVLGHVSLLYTDCGQFYSSCTLLSGSIIIDSSSVVFEQWIQPTVAGHVSISPNTHRLQRLIFKSSLETVYPSAGTTSIEMWLACLPLRVCWSRLSWVIYMCNTFPSVETVRIARGRWPKSKRRCFISVIGASADREDDKKKKGKKKEKKKKRLRSIPQGFASHLERSIPLRGYPIGIEGDVHSIYLLTN